MRAKHTVSNNSVPRHDPPSNLRASGACYAFLYVFFAVDLNRSQHRDFWTADICSFGSMSSKNGSAASGDGVLDGLGQGVLTPAVAVQFQGGLLEP